MTERCSWRPTDSCPAPNNKAFRNGYRKAAALHHKETQMRPPPMPPAKGLAWVLFGWRDGVWGRLKRAFGAGR